MLAKFSGVDFLKTVSKFRKRKRKSLSSFTSSTKREIRHFHVIVVKRRRRNVQKSATRVQSCCFLCRSKPVVLLLFSLSSPSSLRYKLSSIYRVFSHDVTAAILVSQNNETAAMLVSQNNPLGVELFSYANASFCCNKFA